MFSFELNNGALIPAIGLGTRQEKFTGANHEEVALAIEEALRIGYRHFDLAFYYGNEHVVGKVLGEWIASGKGKREDLFITTKLPYIANHPDRMELFLKKSLENINLDYVDLYLIHFPIGFKQKVEEDLKSFKIDNIELEDVDHISLWKKMEEQVDAGRTRSIGVSNFNIVQVERLLKNSRIPPAVNQIELHPYLQQRELVDFCQKNKVLVVAWSPIGSPNYDTVYRLFNIEPKKRDFVLEDAKILELAEKYRKTPAQISLRFLLQLGVGVIPKTTSSARLKENINVLDFDIDGEDIDQIRKLDKGKQGRINDFTAFYTKFKIEEHPEFPF